MARARIADRATRPAARRLDAAGPERTRAHACAQASQGHAGPAGDHADGTRRRARQGRRARRRRGRLRHQAVQSARAARAHQRGAASLLRGGSGESLEAGGLEARCCGPSRDRAATRRSRSARRSIGCCSSSWNTRSACTRAASCSTASGAATSTSRSAPSTSTSAGCARRSSRTARRQLIQTVRGRVTVSRRGPNSSRRCAALSSPDPHGVTSSVSAPACCWRLLSACSPGDVRARRRCCCSSLLRACRLATCVRFERWLRRAQRRSRRTWRGCGAK